MLTANYHCWNPSLKQIVNLISQKLKKSNKDMDSLKEKVITALETKKDLLTPPPEAEADLIAFSENINSIL